MTRSPFLRRFAILAACSLATPLALAYPGLLDTSFGTSGLQSTQLSVSAYASSGTGARAMARQADGKLVVAGPAALDANGNPLGPFAIARYNTDGSLDNGFGIQGRFSAGPAYGIASAVLIDAAGRFLVVGTAFDSPSSSSTSRVAIARFLSGGALDPTYGTNGVALAGFDDVSGALGAAIDASGRLVVTGFSSTFSRLAQGFLVARFDANGTPDSTFGQGGGAIFTLGSAVAEFGRAVALDAQGRIVVAGSAATSGGGIARLLATGALDPAFGAGGKTLLGESFTQFNALALDGAGRVVLAGTHGNPGRMMAARLTEAGVADASFGTGGIALAGFPVTFPLMSSGWALQVDAAGRVLVGGESGPSNPSTFSFARFLPAGTPDTAFGTNGLLTVSLVGAGGSAASGVRALVTAPDGTVYFAGHALGRFALGAIDADGDPVPAFNAAQGNQPVTTPVLFVVGGTSTAWRSVAAMADGRLVAAGSAVPTGSGSTRFVAITRRLASGAADPSFGGTGELAIQPEDGEGEANAVALDGAGRVVVAGTAGPAGFSRFLLLRLLADGTRDAAFGANGEVATAFGATEAIGNALAIDGSGRLVVGGSVYDGATRRLALARHLANGTLDATFGSGGRATLALGADATILALAVDASGRIVAAGRNTATGEALLVRFTAAGVPDAAFGAAGVVSIAGNAARLNAVALDAMGRIVAVGASQGAGGKLEPLVVRIDSAGQPATVAGSGNALVPALAATPVELRGLALDAQGGLLVSGFSAGRLLLARLLDATLLPDAAYGAKAGVTVTSGSPIPTGNGETPRSANAIAIDASGRAVLAGRDTDVSNRAVGLLARFAATTPSGAQPLTVDLVGSGSVLSQPAGIDCGEACRAEYPQGATVTLTATPVLGWRFSGWTGACSGTGSACGVTLDVARTVTATFEEGVAVPAGSRFANLATRMQVLDRDDVLIGGFIIGGALPRTVVVRARGPSLTAAGLTGVLPNPRIHLFSGPNEIASNDDWGTDANAAALAAAGLAPPAANESAILATLAPGGYTAVVLGAGAAGSNTGQGIVEIFDTDPVDGRLVNIATRGRVGTGNDVMIAGFVIQGTQPQSVLIRARGPSLLAQGVPNPLLNPQLQLFSGSTQIAYNDNWQASPDAAFIQSSGFAPTSPAESVIRITLQPGAYTAIVTGVGGVTGVAIVEVFAQ